MSELSDVSTEIVTTRRSPTDNTMMAVVTEKQATSSSFSEIVKNTFGNIFPFTMGACTGAERESQEEEEDDEEQAGFGSQVSHNSSTQENEAYTDRVTYHGPIWCSEDNNQNHKHFRPVRRLCEYDEFGNANWGE